MIWKNGYTQFEQNSILMQHGERSSVPNDIICKQNAVDLKSDQ